ncbi:hypothetical protein DSM43518_03494 [Mycobacterium marinum]|uniref:polyprenyl synthetase family protein n=2 Tax=Mycobacterium marinum TaxID=1781 RepID=UPI00045FE414|nr:polyprenyl synthetase family protein [Mycobacterium marinum]AXN45509.1 hypothetical protein MM1218R_03575 [Mycobacterium marinum]RFZ07026.1 hypothetical protein DSM43518_03494 [Mycobacterium marinum]RFZ10849.1 hypothetical protein DE4381_01502 [Mycobacterium marinum]RFZ15510.1 hypothetical protein VIMS_02329 [Mycobacterium marinum]WCS16685.1 polyprenyl synthetase family protein [Mycobacterium marinum]
MNSWLPGLTTLSPEIESVLAWRDPACRLAVDAAAELHNAYPIVGRAVSALITEACATQATVPHRMLALFVAGSIAGSPAAAVPVAAISVATWAGYEAIDDSMDGEVPAGMLLAGIVAATLLPEFVLNQADISAVDREHYRQSVLDATLRAAEGEAMAIGKSTGLPDWSSTAKIYAAKTGAMYARDAMLAARSCGADAAAQRGWYAFGQMSGLLFQARNDNVECSAAENEDLRNATPTLLLASAAEVDSGPFCEPAELARLRAEAQTDLHARERLAALLCDPDVRHCYTQRLLRLMSSNLALLHELAPPSSYRDELENLLRYAVQGAIYVGEERCAQRPATE